jgi:hypothetical protein
VQRLGVYRGLTVAADVSPSQRNTNRFGTAIVEMSLYFLQ